MIPDHLRLPRRDLLAAAAAGGSAALPVRADEPPAAAGSFPLPPQPGQGLLFSCKDSMTKGGSLAERLASARAAGMDAAWISTRPAA